MVRKSEKSNFQKFVTRKKLNVEKNIVIKNFV